MLGLSVGLGLVVAAAVFASAVLLAYHRGQYWQRPLLGVSMLICAIIATRMSKVGSTRIRRFLYFPAVSSKRYNPVISVIELRRRKKQDGGTWWCYAQAIAYNLWRT